MIDPILGIDIGSVSVAVVLMAPEGGILHAAYRFHRGLIRETLEEELEKLPCRSLGGVACTSSAPGIVAGSRSFDTRVCFVDAARRSHGGLGSLLVVGGEKFAAFRFDGAGRFLNLRASTSCAAGTGSFLDQQAGRLGLSGSAELAKLALANRGSVPRIASRCSVFAKTDLCHAQQAGFSLEEICDGLCLGLARNIADTISGGDPLPAPACFAGGVARNRAVVRHLEQLLGCSLAVDEDAHLFGAIGACLNLLSEGGGGRAESGDREPVRFRRGADLLARTLEPRSYHHPPLTLRLSNYPEFGGLESTLFQPAVVPTAIPVEVERYVSLPRGARVQALLGIDVGSTSTKAVLMLADKRVLAGFYTRTAGRPLVAVQAILEAVDRMVCAQGWILEIAGAATTGAGRQFIGRVVGADLIMNEITAHARAACELDPAVDTIIEIGGQDAKFTTLRGGQVTFSQMNTVCAAGTGSFVEEQAARLGVPLADYSRRAEGVRSPLASDRCTVFMERNINHYLGQKYSVEEILATVLYSVRENYLLKVASEGLIGERICFQGATAKNRALVAAFEEKLQKPIFVSKFCHLAGALGAALSLQDSREAGAEPGVGPGAEPGAEAGAEPGARASGFRGIGLYRESIPVRAETCTLCPNHCRLRIAEVQGQSVAYGFLCGRDYDVERFVNRNTSGFDPVREVRRAHRGVESPSAEEGPVRSRQASVRIGIPAALHVFEELPLWKRFFAELSIPTVTSESYGEALARGKELAGAEFCAPVTALHGHVRWLADCCDYVFLPTVLEAPRSLPGRRSAEGPGRPRPGRRLRYYCYYTQFSPAVVASVPEAAPKGKLLAPLVDHGSLDSAAAGAAPLRSVRRLRDRTKRELFEALGKAVSGLGYEEVARAYDRALGAYSGVRDRLEEQYRRDMAAEGDIRVVLTGRPYLILSPSMSKGIPEIFGSLGVRAYYQDMIPRVEEGPAEPLLDAFHWHYAARILETAQACVRTEGLYPVLVTAFKCSPDSFVIEYFRRLLDAHAKPYLILQIDEHDANLGYETRIEAGVHSFRNHYRSRQEPGRQELGRRDPAGCASAAPPPVSRGSALNVAPDLETNLAGKVLLFPNFDPLSAPLVVAHLQRAGIDARLLEETPLSIQKGMRLNTGQCIPISVITQEMVDYIRKYDLDPARTVLWMGRSNWSCGIHLYPHYIKSLLETQGVGQAGVYAGEISHFELSPRLVVGTYFAYLFGGLLRRIGCRIRPYEVEAGATDRAIAEALTQFVEVFAGRRSRLQTLREVIGGLEAIPVAASEGQEGPGAPGEGGPHGRPKVAIFGDLYVRDNDVMNQDLVHWIEAAGGEVVTTPYSEYTRIIAEAYFRQWGKEGSILPILKNKALLAAIGVAERRFFPLYESYVSPPESYHHPEVERELGMFNLRLEHSGESYDNALKILHLLRVHPDISLFVQTNPSFCCPSLVTEGMTRRIEELTGVPVVTLTYEGTGAPRNDLIMPYLRYPRLSPRGSIASCSSKLPS